jgi:hypothetical protein
MVTEIGSSYRRELDTCIETALASIDGTETHVRMYGSERRSRYIHNAISSCKKTRIFMQGDHSA